MDQETYLKKTSFQVVITRGLKKLIVELSSIKTLFLAFICIAVAKNWISDMWGIIGGMAVMGVKELPSNIFEIIINKIGIGGK